MPRINGNLEITGSRAIQSLVDELVTEMKQPCDFGWPLIIETPIPRSTSRILTIIWDKWAPYTDDSRLDTALKAYKTFEGPEAVNSIGLVEALTIPEAREAGKLPFRIVPLLRRNDPVSSVQCRDAMIEQGASVLGSLDRPELRFPTERMAEACRQRLMVSLPGSENVWAIEIAGDVAAHRDAFLSTSACESP